MLSRSASAAFEDHRSSSSVHSSSQNCQCHSGISSSSAAAAAAASSSEQRSESFAPGAFVGLLRLLCVCFAFKSFESGQVRFITRPKSRTIMLCRFCFCSLKLIDHGSITRLNASDLALSNGGLLGDASAVPVGRGALLLGRGRCARRSLVPAVCTVLLVLVA